MEAEDLIAAALAQFGIDPDEKGAARKFARALGLFGTDDEVTTRRWLKGQNKPGYDATILLLRATGLLLETPGKPLPADVLSQAEPLLRRAREALAELAELFGDAPSPPAPPRAVRGS